MNCPERKKLAHLLREITYLQVAVIDGDSTVDIDRVYTMQQEALELGFNIAMTQIFSNVQE